MSAHTAAAASAASAAVPPLYGDRFERDRLDDLANFYSIVKVRSS
jgi:hypothetical protein